MLLFVLGIYEGDDIWYVVYSISIAGGFYVLCYICYDYDYGRGQ